MPKVIKSLSFQIILALILGAIVGKIFGTGLSSLGEIGKVVITLIKAAATPLLFFVILSSILTSEISGKLGTKLIMITSFISLCALTIGIGLSKIFKSGESLSQIHSTMTTPEQLAKYAGQKINFIESFKAYFPESFMKPFVDNAVISLIFIALLLGFALRRVRSTGSEEEKRVIEKLVNFLSVITKMFEVALTWLVHLVPLAVFGVVAKTVGEFGFEPLKGLAQYLAIGLAGLALHVLIVYQGWLIYKGIPLKYFWKKVRTTLVYAWGVNSSLATLPLTLKSLDELKVSKKAATLGACVGTNLNNDGILLYEGMAVFFVAQAAGIHMDLTTQLTAALICVMGTIGIAGIPEAGFITLSLVLTTVGLPTEILPMLLTVDWILGRGRSVVNVMGDMTVSIALDEKRKHE
ncbi:MAG: dicarboxylate/amino acid:cation symporter [Bdellovibrionales bacterium]|nr:dicarboxylate/amino acid:cation symporter [Bdellovibrionales bacterium]